MPTKLERILFYIGSAVMIFNVPGIVAMYIIAPVFFGVKDPDNNVNCIGFFMLSFFVCWMMQAAWGAAFAYREHGLG